MKTLTTQQGSITLGLVFGLGMLGLGIAAATMTFSTSAISNNSNAAQGVRSLVTADAATREGVYRAIDSVSGTNVTFTGASIPLLNNSDTAAVTVSGTWPLIDIRGEADNARTTRKVVATLDLFPSAFAFDQAVYTHGQLNVTGNVTIEGDIYATNGIDVGGSADIDGDAHSPQTIDDVHGRITGTTNETHPVIEPPEIDYTLYQAQAIIDGTYFTGPSASANAEAFIKGNQNLNKVVYVDGPVSISGGGGGPNATKLTGTLVVNGNLDIRQGTFEIGDDSDHDSPLVIYVNGNLNLEGNVAMNGIVFVDGITTYGNGTPEITGALISTAGTNEAAGNGNITVTYDPVIGAAWQNILGLDTESGTDPMVKNWHEE